MNAANRVMSDAEVSAWLFDVFVLSSGKTLYWQLGSYSRSP